MPNLQTLPANLAYFKNIGFVRHPLRYLNLSLMIKLANYICKLNEYWHLQTYLKIP